MKQQKKRDEITKILTMIYFEWGRPITEELVSYWVGNLRGMKKDFVWKVARELVKRKTYGEPKFQDFWNLATELSERKMITVPYNPWLKPGPVQYVLTDIPGNVVEAACGLELDYKPEPPRGEVRRQLSDHERKWIGYVNPKGIK